MPRNNDQKRAELFRLFRANQEHHDLDCPRGQLICPLCWVPTAVDAFTLEHFIPGAVGGKKETLTCNRCNNRHGSELDSQVATFQSVNEAFEGCGAIAGTIRTREGQHVAVNFRRGDAENAGGLHFEVVGKASNPNSIREIWDDLHSGNAKFNFSFTTFHKSRFQRGLLRIAYLALFHRWGYGFAKHGPAQTIRKRIVDYSAEYPELGPLIGRIENFSVPIEAACFGIGVRLNGIQAVQVLIRSQKNTAASPTYWIVWMPGPVTESDDFFDLVTAYTKENPRATFDISPSSIVPLD